MDEIGVDIWYGGVPLWECDEMGHLNVGFYVAKSSEALSGLAAELGMSHAFHAGAETTLLVRDQHIRFLREARAGTALRMTGGVVEMGKCDARLLMLLRHPDGALAATFQIIAAHVDSKSGEETPWPEGVRARATELAVQVPAEAAARSCSLAPVRPVASLTRANELGLCRTALGMIRPSECDIFGRMRPEVMMARIFDGAAHLAQRPGPRAGNTHDPLAGIGGAAVEYRLLYFAWPRAGDRIEVRAGWASAEPKVRRLIYWVLDPLTGRPWGAADSAVITFDLKARKLIALSGEALDAARDQIVPGLTL